MKEKKKKRKILAALIPVAVLFLAVVVFAQGVLKSEPEAVPNPVQGISADSSLKGYLGTGFAYAGSKTDGNGEEAEEQQEQAQLLPEETPTPTITPEPTKEPVPQTVTPTPEPDVKQWVEAEITSVSADGISVNAKSNTNGEYKMITAVYDENGTLLSVKIRQVEFEKDVPREINVDIEVSRNVAVFFWKDEMTPVSEKIVYDDFDKDGLFPIMNYMKKISMN